MKRIIRLCQNCKQVKKYHGKGLCHNCYNNQYRKNNPEKTRKKAKEYHDRYYSKHRLKILEKDKERWRLWKGEKNRKQKGIRRINLRFLIFQRDNFTCQYCGRKAPNCEIQIDHKYPKSKGGLDKIENYITACRECNQGKGDVILNEFTNLY